MKKRCFVLVLMVSTLVQARMDPGEARACRNIGGQYDAHRGCSELSGQRKSILAFSRRAIENIGALKSLDVQGCEMRGGAHQEPDTSAVKAVSFLFDDHIEKPVIPLKIECYDQNSKFSGSDTICTASFIQVEGANFSYQEREIIFNDSQLSNSTKLTLRNVREAKNSGLLLINDTSSENIFSKLQNRPFPDSDREGCKLAKLVTKDQKVSIIVNAPTGHTPSRPTDAELNRRSIGVSK